MFNFASIKRKNRATRTGLFVAISFIALCACTPMQVVDTYAGNGVRAHADGYGTNASFNNPKGITLLDDGTLVVADNYSRVRAISKTRAVTTLAGNGVSDTIDGVGQSASFSYLWGMGGGQNGEMCTFDYLSQTIRVVTDIGIVTTLAGSGGQGTADGMGNNASFYNAKDCDIDRFGNVYVQDRWPWSRIRRVTPTGQVTTVELIGPEVPPPPTAPLQGGGIAISPDGDIFVADSNRHKIWRIKPTGEMTLFAGTGVAGHKDRNRVDAQFNRPVGLDFDSAGNLFVAEQGNNVIRKIWKYGLVTTIAGSGDNGTVDGNAEIAQFSSLVDLEVKPDGRTIYVNDGTNRIRRIYCKIKLTRWGRNTVANQSSRQKSSTASSNSVPNIIYENICPRPSKPTPPVDRKTG